MNYLLAIFVLLCGQVKSEPQDGSLLFIENGNRIVQRNTDSPITHVGIILKEKDSFVLYEAVPPKVRKINLQDYYKEIDEFNKNRRSKRKVTIWIANAKEPLTDTQKKGAKEYLESQLDRSYSISSYINGFPGRGIHCGELVTETLDRIGIHYAETSCIVSPGDIWEKIKPFYMDKVKAHDRTD